MRRFLLLLPLTLAAACQPLPHPFTADFPREAPPLEPPDNADIVVAPVKGAPATLGLALAAALRDAEIPASTDGPGNKASDHLFGSARAVPSANGRAAITVAWELRAPNGTLIGRGSVADEAAPEAWGRGDPDLVRALAGKAAPAIARLVQAPAPREVAVNEPLVAVGPITGAPGDGGSTLGRAMEYALGRAHVALAQKESDKKSFILTGEVALSPPAQGQQQVKVSWILRRPDGGEVGRVDQQNAVPAGRLDGPWGDIAFAVASAAAPGVAALINKVKGGGGPS
jgi:uncharacterized lipoprotein YmbA